MAAILAAIVGQQATEARHVTQGRTEPGTGDAAAPGIRQEVAVTFTTQLAPDLLQQLVTSLARRPLHDPGQRLGGGRHVMEKAAVTAALPQ
ncbi:hypothetical protein D3C78_1814310 [compost metagenome]